MVTNHFKNILEGRKKENLATFLLVGFFALVLVFNNTKAAFNPQINYQGKLTNTSSVAVADGTYNMEFALYTGATGGTAIWSETCSSTDQIQVTNGLFSHLLGACGSFSDTSIFNQTLYLGVNIGGTSTPSWDGEMSPRRKIGTVPSAFEAGRLGGKLETQFATLAENENITGSWTASNTFAISSSTAGTVFSVIQNGAGYAALFTGGNVGIGTTSPATALHVNGTIRGDNGLNITSGTITFPAVSIATSSLASSQITVTAGTNLTGGGTTALGGSLTLNITSTPLFSTVTSQTSTIGNLVVTSTASFPNSSIATSSLASSQITVTAGTNLIGGGAVLLGGAVTLNVTTTPSFTTVSSTNVVATNGTTTNFNFSNATGSALVLSSYMQFSPAATPTPANGMMYYNTTQNKFRCYQNGGWTDCIGAGTGGTPAGSSGQIQFNDGGSFGATNTLSWNNTSGTLSIGTSTASTRLAIYSDVLATTSLMKLVATGDHADTESSSASIDFSSFEVSTGVSADHWRIGHSGGGIPTFAIMNLENGENYTNAIFNIYKGGSGYSLVGIGTTTPSAILTVQGTTTAGIFNVAKNDSTSAIYVMSTGNVGINTTTPATTLQIVGTTTARNIVPETTLTYNLGASTSRWNSIWAGVANLGTSTWSIGPTSTGRLGIFDGPNAGGNERLTVTTGGLVGIGTTTPAYTLDVNGSIRLIPGSAPIAAAGVAYYDSSATRFKFYDSGAWVSYATSVGAGVPGGSITQIQYNDGGGSFAGASGLAWTSSTLTFGITGTTTVTSIPGQSTKFSINPPAGQAGIINFWQANDPKYAITYNQDTTLTIKPTSTDGIAMNLIGDVGIGGAANTSYKLYVYGNIYATGNITAVGTISGSSGSFGELVVSGSSTFAGNVQMDMNLTVQGYVSSTSLYTGGTPHPAPDIAENFPTDQELEPGDVVALDSGSSEHILKTNSAYQNNAIGAITTNPNILMGQNIVGKGVALSGRIPTKVNLENGDIAIGDYLTASSEAGKAMKATKSGRVIGMATENFTQQDIVNGKDRIVVFVNPHWWQGGEMTAIENKQGQIVTTISKEDLKLKLSELGIDIGDDGTIQVSKLKSEKVITDSIEMKDRATGQTYCLWIDNGEINKSIGECSKNTVTIIENPSASQTEPVSNSEPNSSSSDSNNSSTSSSSSSSEPIVEQSSPNPAPEEPNISPEPAPVEEKSNLSSDPQPVPEPVLESTPEPVPESVPESAPAN